MMKHCVDFEHLHEQIQLRVRDQKLHKWGIRAEIPGTEPDISRGRKKPGLHFGI